MMAKEVFETTTQHVEEWLREYSSTDTSRRRDATYTPSELYLPADVVHHQVGLYLPMLDRTMNDIYYRKRGRPLVFTSALSMFSFTDETYTYLCGGANYPGEKRRHLYRIPNTHPEKTALLRGIGQGRLGEWSEKVTLSLFEQRRSDPTLPLSSIAYKAEDDFVLGRDGRHQDIVNTPYAWEKGIGMILEVVRSIE